MSMRRGFTLLEVLLSVVVFSISATAIGMTFRNVLWAHAMSRESANLREELTQARQAVQYLSSLDDVEAGGEVQLDSNRVAVWSAEVEATEVPDLFEVFLRVEVRSSQSTEDNLEDDESFYLLRPSWSDGIEQSGIATDFADKLREYRDDQQWGWQYP